MYILNKKENKPLYTDFFIVSSCCVLQAIKDLNREACVSEITKFEVTAWVWSHALFTTFGGS